MKTARLLRLAALFAFLLPPAAAQNPEPPHYDHIVVVIDENKNDSEIRSNPLAPYINNTLLPASADLTRLVAETHPSQPNYLHLFSGSNQGVVQDGLPGTVAEPGTLPAPPPFHTPNLGREVLNAGGTFATYSETLPSVGFTGEAYSADAGLNEYVRKHNPAANWQDDAATNASNPWALPSSTNRPFSDFAANGDYSQLPSLSFVVPNEQNDMHDGSITQGDTWLQNNIEPYRVWAETHNSLLIFTFDESDFGALQADPTNQIITAISGQGVLPGQYAEADIAQFQLTQASAPGTAINHYNLLRTIEGALGTSHDATFVAQNGLIDATHAPIRPITDIFASPAPEPSAWVTLAMGTLGLAALRRRARK